MSRSLLFLLEMHSSCSHGEDNGSPWVLCANTESQKDVLLKSEDITDSILRSQSTKEDSIIRGSHSISLTS